MKPYGWRMGANGIGKQGRTPVAAIVAPKARARREGRDAAEVREPDVYPQELPCFAPCCVPGQRPVPVKKAGPLPFPVEPAASFPTPNRRK